MPERARQSDVRVKPMVAGRSNRVSGRYPSSRDDRYTDTRSGHGREKAVTRGAWGTSSPRSNGRSRSSAVTGTGAAKLRMVAGNSSAGPVR